MDKSIIGVGLGRVTFPVERGKVREFATAILDDNPLYLDEEAPPAPPTFTMTQQLWPSTFDEPPADLGINFALVVHGEQEFEYLEPVRAGDVLTGETRVADVYTKEGKRGGTLTFLVLETRFSNQHGKEAVVARATLIETSRPTTEEG
jgi:hypothetical protein